MIRKLGEYVIKNIKIFKNQLKIKLYYDLCVFCEERIDLQFDV